MTSKKRLDIQGLRAVAITGVLIFHVWPAWMPGGYLGVDIFFTLSGYLMAVLLNKPEKMTRQVVGDFYFRRARRIVPVYLCILALSLISAMIVLCRFDYQKMLQDLRPALFFWTNMDVLFADNNYFKELASTKFFLHTWSLAIEWQFYGCVPLLFTLLKRSNKYSFKILLTTSLLLMSLILYFWSSPTWAFEFLPCRVWQFLAGILAFYFGRISQLKTDRLNAPKSTFIYSATSYLLLLVLLLLFLFTLANKFVNFAVIFATSLLLFIGSFNEPNHLLSNFVLVWIGDLSYTLYLVHWPVIQVFRYLSVDLVFGLAKGSIIIILSVFVSVLIYKFIEKPLLKITNLRDLLKTIGCLYFAIFVLYVIAMYHAEPDFVRPTRQIKRILLHHLTNKETREVAIDVLSTEMKSKLNRVRINIPCAKKVQHYHNMLNLPRAKYRWECEVEGNGQLNVLIVGNSHAHSSALAWELALSGKYKRLYWFMTSGCTVFENTYSPNCKLFGNMAVRIINETRPDILIAMHRYPTTPLLKFNIRYDHVFNQMQTFFDIVQPLVSKAIILDRPMFEFPHENGPLEMAKRLLYNLDTKSLGMSRQSYQRKFRDQNRRLNSLTCAKCHLIDYVPFFCRKNYCLPYDPETQVYFFRDNHHLYTYGNYRIAEHYKKVFEKAINGT